MIFPCYHSATSQHEYQISSQCDNTSMLQSQGLHNLTTTSTTLSCSAIASMTRQHCCQHDSTSTSPRGQVALAASSLAWLGSIVAIMTRHLYRVAAKSPQQRHRQHDSTALLSAWLGIYIALRPSHLGSIIASMTWHLHHTTANSPRQRCRQHDSASLSLA
jgi:hypothetical protein